MADKQVSYGGAVHSFPDTFTDDDISNALGQWDSEQKKSQGRSLLQPIIEKAGRNINSRAGGMGYGEAMPSTVDPNDDTGVWSGIKRAYSGLLKMPGELIDPGSRDKYEDQINAATASVPVAGTAINAAKRLLVDPSREASKKSDYYDLVSEARPEQADDPALGSAHMSNMWRMAAAAPVIGPLAGGLVERATVGGDPTGAVGEGGAIITMPKVLEKGGNLLKRAAGKVAYPMADAMNKTPTGTGEINPVDSFTPQEIKNFSEDTSLGPKIDMTPAEITESGGLRAVQGIGQKSLFGKGLLQKRQAASQAGVIARAKNLMNKFSQPSTDVQVARDLQGQVQQAAQTAKANANKAYADWRTQVTGNGPIDIDLSGLQRKYGNMLDANKDIFENIPGDQAGRLKAGMGKASQFGSRTVEDGETVVNPVMDLDSVREMRSHWLDAKREMAKRGRGDTREVALYNDIIHDLDGSIEDGLRQHGEATNLGTAAEKAAAGDALVQGWRQANGGWKKYVEDFHGDDSVMSQILDTPQTDLVKMPGQILERGTGGNPIHIDQLRSHGIKLGGLQRTIADRALNTGFRTSQNRLAGYEDDFLQSVFADNPGDLENLYKTARVGRSVGVDFNPSNTAGTMLAREEAMAPVRAGTELATGNPTGAAMEVMNAVPGYGAAKLSTSKMFKNWMTRQPSTPVGRWLLNRKGGPNVPPSGGGAAAVPPTAGGNSPAGSGGTGPVSPTPTVPPAPAPTTAPTLTMGSAVSNLKTGKTIDLGGYTGPERRVGERPSEMYRRVSDELEKNKQELGLERSSKVTLDASQQKVLDKMLEQNLPKPKLVKAAENPDAEPTGKTPGNASFRFGANKLKKKGTGGGPKGTGPEGPAKPGTGPGAMLRKGASLGPQMKPGPETGPGVVLYHGTAADRLGRINAEGLRNAEDIVGANSADSTKVNLTRDPRVAEFYAGNGADAEGSPKSQDGAVLAVEVPRSAIDDSEMKRESYRYRRFKETGEWPVHKSAGGSLDELQHEGLYSEPGEFRIIRSTQPIPPELIKGAVYTDGTVNAPRGGMRNWMTLVKAANKLRRK